MLRHVISLVGFGLLLAGCGSTASGNPGTSSSGPVIMNTDHTIYAPGDAILVTVQNTLSNPIYAFDTQASCSILSLQYQANGTWQGSQVARCPLGRPARLVKIDAGATYTANITANTPGLNQFTFPTGSYRLVLLYTTSSSGVPSAANGVTVISATIQVQQPTS